MTNSTLTDPSILGTLVLPVAEVLTQRGIDAREVIQGAGLDLESLSKPDYRVHHMEFNELMRRCVEATGDEAFGLYCAEAMQPDHGMRGIASGFDLDGLQRREILPAR